MTNEQCNPPKGGKPRRNGSDALGSNTEIARKLGDYFKGLESEDIPDHFIELLNKLDRAEAGQKKD